MYNMLYAFVTVAMAAVAAAVFLLTFKKKLSWKMPRFLRIFCTFYLCWAIATALFYLIPDRELALKVQMYKYIGVAFAPVFGYVHVRTQIIGKQASRLKISAMSIVPTVTSIICITGLSPLFFSNIGYAVPEPGRLISASYGPWFYVHSLYSYVFIMLSLATLFKTYFLMPGPSRRPVVLMITGILAIFASNFLIVSGVIVSEYDITLFGGIVMLVLLYMAHGVIVTSNIIIMSRQRIYESFSNMIMVLDTNRAIIDGNRRAFALLRGLSLPVIGTEYDDFKSLWIERKNGRISPYDSSILTVDTDGSEVHYRIITQEVDDRIGALGYIVEIQEITDLYALFRFLEESAVYDHLTGAYNRNSFMKKLEQWDGEDQLPLGVIIGDINRLKYVNDAYGHLVGDALLIAVSEAIRTSCPEDGYYARIGGDEFAILMPHSSLQEMEDVKERIRQWCACHTGADYGTPSVALGSMLRTSVSQAITKVIENADLMMYRDKNNRRKI